MTPELQQKNYLHKFVVQKDVFNYYMSHYPYNGEGRNKYLTRKIRSWLEYEFYNLSRFPYKSSKQYLSEWKEYYKKLAPLVGYETYPLNTIRLYFKLPFPLYYYSRKLKDSIAGKENGIGYDSFNNTLK